MSNLKNFLFTSESVSEGHPDKVSDRISDMVVDTYLSGDPYSRVACETLTTTNKVVLAGEVRGPKINKDDLLTKNPDALLNGDAVIKLVKSCVPNVKNPGELLAPDMEAILIAIRQASSKEKYMEVNRNCPECDEPNTFNLDLGVALANAQEVSASLGQFGKTTQDFKGLNTGSCFHLEIPKVSLV